MSDWTELQDAMFTPHCQRVFDTVAFPSFIANGHKQENPVIDSGLYYVLEQSEGRWVALMHVFKYGDLRNPRRGTDK